MESALRVLVSTLTQRYLDLGGQNIATCLSLLQINRKLNCLDHLDILLRKLWQEGKDVDEKALIAEIMMNYDKGAKDTITLVPQIIIGRYNAC